jgi:hypothetical protein
LEGKKSQITTFRINRLGGLGFDWDCSGATWEDRLSELADFRKIHGHCNAPQKYSENTKLGKWVGTRRDDYRLHVKGKTSPLSIFRINGLDGLGFNWDYPGATWEDRLSELVDYRKIHGHCNVPQRYSENYKLGHWVGTQRKQYKLHLEEKTSQISLTRIQALESLGFEWKASMAG